MTRYHLWIETADGAVLKDVMPAENARQACDVATDEFPGHVLVMAEGIDAHHDTYVREAGT